MTEIHRISKMLFIYNPKAGKAGIRTKLSDVLEIFSEKYEIMICPTSKQGDAQEIMEHRKDDFSLVVCSGGDGTLNEVVTGMMKSGFKTPIGYIPAGSTNDFGGSLKLPKNIPAAAKIAAFGKNFSCDVGKFNDGVFVYIAAFGLFTEVSYETDQQMKNVLGHMAYLLEGVKSLQNIRTYRMKVKYDGKEIEDDFIYGMITNSFSVGGFKSITGKKVKLDDGLFEVTLIKSPRNPMELNDIRISLLNRDIDSRNMYCFTASRLEIESEESIAWTLDGEFGGEHDRVEIENLNKGMEIRIAES